MAVIDEVPQMTARVRVAGQLATEYEAPDDFEMIDDPSTEEDTTPSKHCYIECKSGAEFAIEVEVSSDFKIPRTNDTIWIQVFIDGGYMDNLAVDKHDLRNKGQVTGIMSSARCVMDTGRAMDKKFVFAPITRNDSTYKAKIEEDVLRAKGLGTIVIAVFTAKNSKTQLGISSDNGPTCQKSDFAEKALKGKGISHATSLAETGAVLPIPVYVNIENEIDVGKFFFHYRSYEALQNEMVILRAPPPEPPVVASDGEDDLSHLSESEIRRLAIERLRDNKIKLESSGIKREADESTPTPRSWKFVKLDDGKEAVDLTDE